MAKKARQKQKSEINGKDNQHRSFFERHFSKLIITTIVLGIAILAIARFYTNRDPKEQKPQVSEEVLQQGKTLYQASCASCHEADGAGRHTDNVPGLNGSMHSWHHPDEYLIRQIRDGGIAMPAVGANWSNEDIEAVISYFKQWWTGQQRRAQQGNIGE